MASRNELLEKLVNAVAIPRPIVSCPSIPVEIGGITLASALGANDAFGNVVVLQVPKYGVIYSATFWDLDYDGLQVDLEVFKRPITQVAWNGAWSVSDTEILDFVTKLAFVSFDSHTLSYTSELTNIGKAYTAPEGKFYIQAVARGASEIAIGLPKFQLQIISYDPDFIGG